MKVKVIGAGSIGNHLTQAARRMGWNVVVVDNDPKALVRMREEIYPKRYGEWDDEIQLFVSGSAEEPRSCFDIIMVGTPPDVRMRVAREALQEKPRLLHLEKPLCAPNLHGIQELLNEKGDTLVTVGYNHAVAPSIDMVVKLVRRHTIGNIITIDVEFREHWQGIFNAHSWLFGPEDSYLGYWQRGGGAGGEHSHALHLWMYLAFISQNGLVDEVKAMFAINRGEKMSSVEYDEIAAFLLKTNFGCMGSVVQDVVTKPPRKWARLQGTKGWVEWTCESHNDFVRYSDGGDAPKVISFPKNRPDDFFTEMLHYDKLFKGEIKSYDSPLDFKWGLRVMKVLNYAYNQLPLDTVNY